MTNKTHWPGIQGPVDQGDPRALIAGFLGTSFVYGTSASKSVAIKMRILEFDQVSDDSILVI